MRRRYIPSTCHPVCAAVFRPVKLPFFRHQLQTLPIQRLKVPKQQACTLLRVFLGVRMAALSVQHVFVVLPNMYHSCTRSKRVGRLGVFNLFVIEAQHTASCTRSRARQQIVLLLLF